MKMIPLPQPSFANQFFAHRFLSLSFSLFTIVSNFNVRDLGTIAGATVISAPVGHLIGEDERRKRNRKRDESNVGRFFFFFPFLFSDLFLL